MSGYTCPRCSAGLPCRGIDTPRLHELAARDTAWIPRLDPASVLPGNSPPSLLAQAASLIDAGKKFVASGLAMAPDDVAAERLATCLACDHFDPNRCRVCGCHMPVKVKIAAMACPVGKWPAV